MATYKVPQDVEAEDKIVGFLSLKQLIMVVIMLASLYMCYVLGQINIVLGLIPLPIAFVSGMLGLYQRKDQPVEVYLASWIRFKTKPRTRKWDQEGYEERVIITVPKVLIKDYTKGMNTQQVTSRLNQLSAIMDSRGWATKQVLMQNTPANLVDDLQPVAQTRLQEDQRLFSTAELAQFVPAETPLDGEMLKTPDLYDQNAPIGPAQQVEKDIKQTSKQQHDQALQRINEARSETAQHTPPQVSTTTKPPPMSTMGEPPQSIITTPTEHSVPHSPTPEPLITNTAQANEADETIIRIQHKNR